MELVDRHAGVHSLALAAGVHPCLVAPGVAGGVHHAGVGRRALGGERQRIGLEHQPAIGPEHLVLVFVAHADAGNEQLPDPRGAEHPHRVQAPVPAVEVADHPHRAGVGRPHREGGTGHALQHGRVGTEPLPQPLVPALADQVLVQLTERRQEPVGVVDLHDVLAVGDLQPVGGQPLGARPRRRAGLSGQGALEQAGRVDPLQDLAPTVGQDAHLARVGAPGPDAHLAGLRMGAEQAVGLVVLPTHQALDLLLERHRHRSFVGGNGWRG